MDKPSKLYRYESVTPQSLRNLEQRVVYFSAPTAFNDPFDCALSPKISAPTDEELSSLLASMRESRDVPRQVIEQASALGNEEFGILILDKAAKALDEQIESFQSER